MNKREFIEDMKVITPYNEEDITAIWDAGLGLIKAQLDMHNTVHFRGFGEFKVVSRKARKARDIRNDKMIDVPEKDVVKFKSHFNIMPLECLD